MPDLSPLHHGGDYPLLLFTKLVLISDLLDFADNMVEMVEEDEENFALSR